MPYIGNVLTSFAVETGNISDQAITSPKLSATGGTDGQVLALDSNGDLVWSSDPAGQWVTSGNDIFYTTGNVGIGVNSPGQALDVADVDIAPLRVTRDQAVSSGAGLVLRQPNTTDGNDLRIVYQTDTTGTGASSDVFFAALEFSATTHDHDTRAGEIGFFTAQGGTGFVDRMRIRSDGTVRIGGSTLAGIGTKVQVHDGSDNRNILGVTGADVTSEYIALGIISGDPTITAGNAGSGDTALRFDVASSGTESEAMRLDASGRLLHGTSASVTAHGEIRNVQIVTDVNNGNQGLGIYAFTSGNNAPRLDLGSSPNGTINSFTTASSVDDLCGRINFLGSDGDEFLPTARIEARVDGTVSNGDMPGRLTFLTTADSAASPTERMRISANGNITVDTDTFFVDAVNNRVGAGTSSPSTVLHVSDTDGTITIEGTRGTGDTHSIATGGGNSQNLNINAASVFLINSDTQIFRDSAGTTEYARIDSSGRLLVGTATSASQAAAPAIECIGNTTRGGELALGRDDTEIAADHSIGFITFRGNDSNGTYDRCAQIDCAAEGGHSNTSKPSRLAFSVTESGSDSPTERMRIDNRGRVLIGTQVDVSGGNANPSVQIVGDGENSTGSLYLGRNDSEVISSNEIGKIEWVSNDGGTYEPHARITVQAEGGIADGDKPGRIMFFTCSDGSATPTERLRIASDGVLQLRNSPGIDFSQIQGAPTNGTTDSEVLDNYEEGSWTPGLSFGDATTGIAYGTQDGHYIRVGRMVYCMGMVTLTDNGTATGDAKITGLPYQVSDLLTGTSLEGGGLMTYAGNINGTIEPPYTVACTNSSTTATLFASPSSNELTTNMQESNFANNASIRFSFTYIADT